MIRNETILKTMFRGANSQWLYLVAGMILLTSVTSALAHSDLDHRIEDLTLRIQKHSANADLYLKRAELHRLNADWDAALRDYDNAERLAPNLTVIDFYRGRMWAEEGSANRARRSLDQFLAAHPDQTEALLVRSHVLAALGHIVLAADDLGIALTQTDSPQPDLYLRRAVLLASAGDSHVDTALATIDQGIARLGPLVTLIQMAFETEAERRRFDSALTRIEQLPVNVQESPIWLKHRGDLLRDLEKYHEARKVYSKALAKIQRLPDSRRSSPAIHQLEKSLLVLTEIE